MKILKYCILIAAVISVAAMGSVSCLRGGTLSSITVTPANPTIAYETKQQFTATATFSDGTTLNWTTAATWKSSDDSSAVISNTTGSNGIATSLASGTTGTITITATDAVNNISGTATLHIANPQSIAVTPSNPFMAIGTTYQFTATAAFPDNNEQNLTSFATWTTIPVTGSATVSSTGLVTAGTTTGTTDITATDFISNITGSATLTVTETPLLSITVGPINQVISLAAMSQQQFTATGNYTDGSAPDFTPSVTWSSSNLEVATISNTAGSNGLASAVAAGSTTITATDPITSKSESTTLYVTPKTK